MPGYAIQQSTANQPLAFLLVSSTDHLTGLTGATPTVTLSKNGAAFASPAGAVSEIGNGWYKVAGNATDSNTLGPLILHATATGADPSDTVFPVVAYNPLSATNLGLSALPTASPGASGGLPTANASGNVGADVQTIKTQTVTCSAGVTVEPFVGTATAALVVDSSGRVILQPTQTGVTIPTVTTVTNQLTAAQIATGVWQDTTAGDFTVASSIGKSLYTSGNVPGAANGLFIAGSNAATTVNITGNLSGSVASVTGAVGSVTGNVGGNVVGSVASVTATVSANVTQWLGTAPPTPSVAGVPIVDVHYYDGKADTATAQGGTTTTITLASGESQTISYAAQYVAIISGTGAGQARYVLSSTATSGSVVLTIDPPWDVAPDATSVYQLGGFGYVSVAGYSNTATLPASRDITSVADSSLTPADVAWSALAGVGRWDASSGTSLVIATPGGSTFRTSAITTSATNPYGTNFPVTRS